MPTPDTVLILAAHGSSHPQAREALEGFAARVRQEHPGLHVRMAYTATPRSGNHPGSGASDGSSALAETLADLSRRGGGARLDLRVQSLHVIAGADYDRMRQALRDFAAATGAALAVRGPLLEGATDAPEVARTLALALPQGAPTVLMGHGTTHGAQDLYRVLAGELSRLIPEARLGVLEAADPGDPLSIHAIARELSACGARSARLVPLLTVAGRHAHKDLAGDRPGSWKSVLAEHGIEGLPDLAGLLERDAFARRWLSSIRDCLSA